MASKDAPALPAAAAAAATSTAAADSATSKAAAAAFKIEKRKPGAKIPVTILTGFLGAGKTTLVNYILKSPDHGLKFAIIENEFGDVGVDDAVLKCESKEAVVEMMNGCICCTVRADLTKVLARLAPRIERDNIDAVIIETTGLADPAPVAQTFFVDPTIEKRYFLDGIITVVDSKHIIPHLLKKVPEGAENEAVEQVAFADRVILNKMDLVTEDEAKKVVAEIKKINHGVEIIRSTNSIVPAHKLFKISAFNLDQVLKMDPEFLDTDGEHEHDQTVGSVSWRMVAEFNVNKLQRWIGELMQTKAADLYRYKGVLAVKGMAQKFVFQGVHMLFSGNFSDTEWAKGEKKENCFVFIGKNIDKKELTEGFMKCIIDPKIKLRFKVGDLVQANLGGDGWCNGKIIRTWDTDVTDGNPYRIELEAPKAGVHVWGPIDNDELVRAR